MKYENITLYGEKNFCEQLAYVLNPKKYTIISDLNKYKLKSKLILCEKYDKSIIRKLKLKKNKDYYKLNYIYKLLNKNSLSNIVTYDKNSFFNKYNLVLLFNYIRPKINNKKIINKIPVYFLKPSEMFIKTVNAKTTNIDCKNLENNCWIDYAGYMWGCCPTWVRMPHGNIINGIKSYYGYIARILKLSSINRTYCFCNLNKCTINKFTNDTKFNYNNIDGIPKNITIGIDKTCNLKCKSCRTCLYNKPTEKTKLLAKKIMESDWLDKTDELIIAGQGEVFYSPVYRELLTSKVKRNKIQLLTNGTLLNEKNWKLIEDKYNEINIYISIDAATKETYRYLRCGNFDQLYKNLEMLSKLRKQNKLQRIELNFVVQKDNYLEMEQFIKMAKKLNVDIINFTKLNNWGTFTKKEFKEKSMIIDDKYLEYDLYKYLQKKIFKDKIVNLDKLQNLIEASKIVYNEEKTTE